MCSKGVAVTVMGTIEVNVATITEKIVRFLRMASLARKISVHMDDDNMHYRHYYQQDI